MTDSHIIISRECFHALLSRRSHQKAFYDICSITYGKTQDMLVFPIMTNLSGMTSLNLSVLQDK